MNSVIPTVGVSAETLRNSHGGGQSQAPVAQAADFLADYRRRWAEMPPETGEERATRERRVMEVQQAERTARFRRVCPAEFMHRVDAAKLSNQAAYERVKTWDGRFPGPLCTGATGASKTRAAWASLYSLNVLNGRSFAWFPVKRLITEFERYERKGVADEFWKFYASFDVLFVDDADKFNAQFESEGAALFAFYDWVYREHRPCITTTNKPREWWANLMGEAHARRLFDDAHIEVDFDGGK